jgi:hypothetical protein
MEEDSDKPAKGNLPNHRLLCSITAQTVSTSLFPAHVEISKI